MGSIKSFNLICTSLLTDCVKNQFEVLLSSTSLLMVSLFSILALVEWPQDWKRSVFIAIPKKGNAKECSNYCTIALISHTSKQCSNFSKPGFNSTRNVNFQMFKLDLEKAEEPEIKLPTSAGSKKEQERSRKTSISALFLIQ